QLVGREPAMQPASNGQRHLASFLGNDDRKRVALLGQTDGGTMPRAEIAIETRADREWKEARRCRDAIFLNDRRAIVQRRRRLKNGREQVVADFRIERNA